jgi:predicted ATPase
MTREQPTLLILDDLQWSATPTLLLLRHLIRSERPLNVLLLGTYRQTEVEPDEPLGHLLADLHRDAGTDCLTISGLDEPAIAALLEAAVGHPLGDRASQRVRVLQDQTAGNPFFVRELLAAEPGRTLGANVIVAHLQPREGLRQVIGQRVARLSAVAGRALNVAAVAGPRCSFALLERVLGERPDVLDGLDEAVAAGLLCEAGDEYVFAHALVRDTIYGQLGSARRTRLHRQLGEAVDALGAADAPVEALAYRFA